MIRKRRRPTSDALYSVLADILFSVMIAVVTLVQPRVDITDICVVEDQLDESGTAVAGESDTPVFRLSSTGVLSFGDSPMSFDDARLRLSSIDARSSENRVLLRVAADCGHQKVAEFYKLCQDKNFNVTEQLLTKETKDPSHE